MSARVRVATDHEGGLVTIKAARTFDERQALRHEAELLRRCSHPGVVALVGPADLDQPLTDGEMAVRYAGDPLDRWRGDLRRTAGLVAAIAATLGDLHDMGVVHGRIDGTHVLVGSDGRPRLCGFAPPAGRTPADDVLDLGHLATELVDRMVPSEQRWPLWRRGDVADRRAFLDVLHRATDDAGRRPSARVLAAALLAAVPGAELPIGDGPAPPIPTPSPLPGTAAGARVEPDSSAAGAQGRWPDAVVGDRPTADDEQGSFWSWPGPDPGADPGWDEAPPAAGGDRDREPSGWSPAVAPSRFVRPDDRSSVVGAAFVTDAGDPTEDVDPWRSRLTESPGVGPRSAPGDDGDRSRSVDPLFGDQSSVELDEVFAHRPWPADRSSDRQAERAPRHPSPSRRRRSRRRRSTRGMPAAPVVAVLAAVVVGAVLYAKGWARLPDDAGGSTASADCSSPPATAAIVADIDGDGCREGITIADGIVQVDDQRWAVGEADDSVVVADWDCDGRATPAVYKSATGAVFVFPSWADATGPLEVEAAASVVGGTGIAVAAADDPCPPLTIEMPDGGQRPVEVTG